MITFASLAIPPFWENESTLLVESLRMFGGALAKQPFHMLTIKGKPLKKKTLKTLSDFGVETAEFEMDEESLNFPLALVAHGAAAAEKRAQGHTSLLVWLLPDTLILNEPGALQLPAHTQLGYRPVHHQNIGSTYSQPPDAFWQQIYRHCDVREERLFRMETCYREAIRPYFNAGILVTRPENGIMTDWLETFQRTFQHPDFVPFFKQRKYAIFMHQAVLVGVILNRVLRDQLLELPESYNYPLHMHQNYPTQGQPTSLNQLITARYERRKLLPKFFETIEIDPHLLDWLGGKKLHT